MNFKPFTNLRSWLVAFLLALLIGNTPTFAQTIGRTFHDDCYVTVTQDGNAVPAQTFGDTLAYSLRGAPFRIEVASAACDASIGVLPNLADFKYVANNTLAATVTGFEMARGPEGADILFLRDEDPRVPPDYQAQFDPATKQHESLCKRLKKCPPLIRAYRSYWPFLIDAAGTPRNFAVFNRLTYDKPLAGAKGNLPVIIYTKIKPNSSVPEESDSSLRLLAIHAFILMFN